MKRAILELHDVTPYFRREFFQTIDFLDKLKISKFSLLVIPDYWNRYPLEEHLYFVNFLKDLQEEILLHGYNHLGPKKISQVFWTDGEGEFSNLTYEETFERVNHAIRVFQQLGISTKIFVPPAWLGNPYLEDVLLKFDFVGVAYRDIIKSFRNNKKIFCPALSLSNRKFFSELSMKLSFILKKFYQSLDCIRLSIHMADFRDYKKIKLWKEILEEIKPKRRFINYEELFS